MIIIPIAHTAHKLGQVTAAGDCTTTPKRLKFDIADGIVVFVNSNLQFHDIAASWCTDEASTDVDVGF